MIDYLTNPALTEIAEYATGQSNGMEVLKYALEVIVDELQSQHKDATSFIALENLCLEENVIRWPENKITLRKAVKCYLYQLVTVYFGTDSAHDLGIAIDFPNAYLNGEYI